MPRHLGCQRLKLVILYTSVRRKQGANKDDMLVRRKLYVVQCICACNGDLRTGYRSKMSRAKARASLRSTSDMKAARKYANG